MFRPGFPFAGTLYEAEPLSDRGRYFAFILEDNTPDPAEMVWMTPVARLPRMTVPELDAVDSTVAGYNLRTREQRRDGRKEELFAELRKQVPNLQIYEQEHRN